MYGKLGHRRDVILLSDQAFLHVSNGELYVIDARLITWLDAALACYVIRHNGFRKNFMDTSRLTRISFVISLTRFRVLPLFRLDFFSNNELFLSPIPLENIDVTFQALC